jgi:hypothetical protein
MKKEYTVRYDWWECKILIDDEIAKEPIKECVEFWYNWESRLQYFGGDYEQSFVSMLANNLIKISMDKNLLGAIREIGTSEGWFKIDGSQGVKLTHMDHWYFDEQESEIVYYKEE